MNSVVTFNEVFKFLYLVPTILAYNINGGIDIDNSINSLIHTFFKKTGNFDGIDRTPGPQLLTVW